MLPYLAVTTKQAFIFSSNSDPPHRILWIRFSSLGSESMFMFIDADERPPEN